MSTSKQATFNASTGVFTLPTALGGLRTITLLELKDCLHLSVQNIGILDRLSGESPDERIDALNHAASIINTMQYEIRQGEPKYGTS